MTGLALAVWLVAWTAALAVVGAGAVFVVWVAFLAFLDPGDGRGRGGHGPRVPGPDPGGVVLTRRDVQLAA